MTPTAQVERWPAVVVPQAPVTTPPDDDPHDTPEAQVRRVQRTALWVIGGYPLLWVLGLGGLFWPVLAGVLAFRTAFAARTAESRLLLMVPQLLVLSIPLGLISFGFDGTRLVSLAANVAVWFATAALVRLACADQRFRADVLRAVMLVAAAQGAITGLAYLVHPQNLPVPLLHPIAEKLPSGMATFATNQIMALDWLDGALMRSSGTMGNPTWAGAVGALGLLIGLGLRNERSHDWLLRLLAVGGGAVAVHFALSRSVQIATIGALALATVEIARRKLSLGFTPYVVGALAVPVAVYVWAADAIAWATSVNAERAGSAETRGAIYTLTWHYIQQLPIPLLGYGIKPKSDGLVASVASHSTYLGLTFRAGAVATVLFAVAMLVLARRAARAGDLVSLAIVVFVATWCLFEDFDGGHLLPLGLLAAALAPAPGPPPDSPTSDSPTPDDPAPGERASTVARPG